MCYTVAPPNTDRKYLNIDTFQRVCSFQHVILGPAFSDHSKHPLLLSPSEEEEVQYIPENLYCSGAASRHQKKKR